MKVDKLRIKKFLSEIQKDTLEIEGFLKESLADKRTTKAIRYNLIEIVEAAANISQHILAKDKGMPASGYLEVIESAKKENVIGQSSYAMLKPFFEFRNTLVHKYWTIKDDITNIGETHAQTYNRIRNRICVPLYPMRPGRSRACI